MARSTTPKLNPRALLAVQSLLAAQERITLIVRKAGRRKQWVLVGSTEDGQSPLREVLLIKAMPERTLRGPSWTTFEQTVHAVAEWLQAQAEPYSVTLVYSIEQYDQPFIGEVPEGEVLTLRTLAEVQREQRYINLIAEQRVIGWRTADTLLKGLDAVAKQLAHAERPAVSA